MSGGLKRDLSSDEVFINRFPIHRACRDGDVGALVSMLGSLSNRTHLTVEDAFFGWTPLHWAAHNGQVHLLIFSHCSKNYTIIVFKMGGLVIAEQIAEVDTWCVILAQKQANARVLPY